MAQIKITREQLEHDRFLETTDTFLIWLKKNLRLLLIILIAGIAVYSAYGYMVASQRSTNEAANDAFARAQARYNRALMETTWGSPERTAAMEEVVLMARAIREQYSATPLTVPAHYLEGSAWYYAGDDLEKARTEGARNTEKAIDVFTKYVANAQPASFEYAKGSVALGYAYENAWFLTGRESYLSDAMNTFRQVTQQSGTEAGFMRHEAMLSLARLHELAGNEDQAIAILRDLMKETHAPRVNPDRIDNPNRALVQRLRTREDLFTYAGLARMELSRLGVDVDQEFPLFVEPEPVEG
jgi:tetratricopeptide (TPR) repeat protein